METEPLSKEPVDEVPPTRAALIERFIQADIQYGDRGLRRGVDTGPLHRAIRDHYRSEYMYRFQDQIEWYEGPEDPEPYAREQLYLRIDAEAHDGD